MVLREKLTSLSFSFLILFFFVSGLFSPGPIITYDSINDCEQGEGYNLLGHKWTVFPIQYFIGNVSSGMVSSINKAFEIWDDLIADKLFIQTFNQTEANLTISLGSEYFIDDIAIAYAHTDYVDEIWVSDPMPDPFFIPAKSGVIVFDENTIFRDIPLSCDDIDIGQDTLSVALHEIGHTLGLAHYGLFSLTMFEFTSFSAQKTLAPGDIAGFHAIYGGGL